MFYKKDADFIVLFEELFTKCIEENLLNRRDLECLFSVLKVKTLYNKKIVSRTVHDEVIDEIHSCTSTTILNSDYTSFQILLNKLTSDVLDDITYQTTLSSFKNILKTYKHSYFWEIDNCETIPLLHRSEIALILSQLQGIRGLIPIYSRTLDFDNLKNGSSELRLTFTYDHTLDILSLKNVISNAFYNAVKKSTGVSYYCKCEDGMFTFNVFISKKIALKASNRYRYVTNLINAHNESLVELKDFIYELYLQLL